MIYIFYKYDYVKTNKVYLHIHHLTEFRFLHTFYSLHGKSDTVANKVVSVKYVGPSSSVGKHWYYAKCHWFLPDMDIFSLI